MDGVEFSVIYDHHEAEKNQNFGENFHEDLEGEENNMKCWQSFIFGFVPSYLMFNMRPFWREAVVLPDVIVGVGNGEKWEQDGHCAPVDNLLQVTEIYF